MRYSLEELVPLVAELSERYTSKESSSITYEKANQLMGAVQYCIRENRRSLAAENNGFGQTGKTYALANDEKIPAEKAYERGLQLVEEKVQKAMELYHELLPSFEAYGNQCLADTITKGMPEFFKRYDVRFRPQDTILTLDYPVLTDLTKYSGIDAVYEYLRCIALEQEFLQKMPKAAVRNLLLQYCSSYKDMVDNLCAPILSQMMEQGLGKMNERKNWSKEADIILRQLIKLHYNGNPTLYEYLLQAVADIVIRLQIKC